MLAKNIINNSQINLLILTPRFHPDLGGVEKHVLKTAQLLQKNPNLNLNIITATSQPNQAKYETINNLPVLRFSFPKIKYLGLIIIWLKLISQAWHLFKQADVVHVHDVMIWCLPMRLLFPRKKIILTIHGWEGIYPIPQKNIWLKKISAGLANQAICVGTYIKKYYGIDCEAIIEGAVEVQTAGKVSAIKKQQGRLVFLGRLTEDTGLLILLQAWKKLKGDQQKKFNLVFIGDGPLRAECQSIGTVLGELTEAQVEQQLASADSCVVGGYLSAMEALAAGCRVVVTAQHPLKKDYWQMSSLKEKVMMAEDSKELIKILEKLLKPADSAKIRHNQAWAKEQTWQKIAKLYFSFYTS